jgi:CubicO group peptidase (beta-lactamase class C family)
MKPARRFIAAVFLSQLLIAAPTVPGASTEAAAAGLPAEDDPPQVVSAEISLAPSRPAEGLWAGDRGARGPWTRAGDNSVDQQAAFAAVDACAAAEMTQQNTPGASLAIAVGGRQVYTQTYGLRHPAQGGSIKPSTYFRINSTTKMMTAAAAMVAAERGQIDLNAPITDHLSDLKLREPWRAGDLTLHHLLSNTSGLPGGYVDLGVLPPGRPPLDLSLLDWTKSLQLMHLFAPPESFFNYSSAGFSLAGAVLEQATGQSYAALVEQTLWRPAGLQRITMDPDDVIADGDYATGYFAGRPWDPREYAEPFSEPAGGAYSTPSELLKWAGMLSESGRGLLSPESVAMMTTSHAQVANVPITNHAGYGYGIFVEEFRRAGGGSARVLYHPGNGRGYSTELFWVPETGFAIAILATTPSGLDQSALCALREIEGLTRQPLDRSPPSDAELERYAGTYALVDEWGNAWTARVWKALDGLKIVYSDWSTLPTIGAAVPEAIMEHRYGSRFRYEGYGASEVLFIDDAAGDPHPRWLEHLTSVGQRAGDLPAEIELTGGSCKTVEFTPDQDGPGSRLKAYGVNPIYAEEDLPIRQGDAARPDRSAFKLDLPASGEITFLMAYHWSEQDDSIDMYLVHDADEDGEFSWPEELVDARAGTQGLLAQTPLPAGDYQLWMHGRAVNGANSRFQLDVVMVAGDGLRLNDVPEALEAGTRHRVELCADKLFAEESHLGMLSLDLGDGKRVAHVPVRVLPNAVEPPRRVYLPVLWARAAAQWF